MGHKQFAWIKHQMEELKCPLPLLNDDGEEVDTEYNNPVPSCIYKGLLVVSHLS
jgi:hypothetical protein